LLGDLSQRRSRVGGYKLQMQQKPSLMIYSTPVAGAVGKWEACFASTFQWPVGRAEFDVQGSPVAGAVGKWEARFAFRFSMALPGNGSGLGALADVVPVVLEVEGVFWEEQFRRGFPAKCLSRSGIKVPGDLIELALGESRQVG
jgi:hypothetical protein